MITIDRFQGTIIVRHQYQYGTVIGFSDEIRGRNAVHWLRLGWWKGRPVKRAGPELRAAFERLS